MFERIQVLITALLLAAIVIWLQFYQLETQSLLDQFDFDAAVLWAEPWRIFSAHLFHLDTQHAISNAIGVLLPCLFFVRHFTVRTWLNAFIIIAASTSIIIWLWGAPSRFVGLSGVIHGLFVTGLLLDWGSHQYHRSQWLLPTVLALLVVKVVLEIAGLMQSSLLLNAGADFGYIHAAGILGGLIAWRLHRRHLASIAKQSKPAQRSPH